MNNEIVLNESMDDCPTIGNDGTVLSGDQSVYSISPSSESSIGGTNGAKRKSFITTIKDAFKDSYRFEDSPECIASLRKCIIDGKDISTITSKEIENMSIEEAKHLISCVHLEGNLRKKGFRRLQLWKRRYFELNGSIVSYFEIGNMEEARRKTTIQSECKIMVENVPGHPYAFSFLPNRNEKAYYIDAYSMQQRDQWIRLLTLVTNLTKRLSAESTFKTYGNIHNDFSFQDDLGNGGYGHVVMGKNLKDGEMCAIKIISRGNVEASILTQELMVLREMMNSAHCEDIVWIKRIYEDPSYVYVVMEYLGGGDLYKRLSVKNCFSERDAAKVIQHIGNALLHLHHHHIYHLDVKPENIIYESNDNHSKMKLTDFGCSLLTDLLNRDTNEIVGTPGFMAPEVIQSCSYTDKADVYSLGVTLHFLLVGYPPFLSDNPTELMKRTVNDRIEYRADDWNALSEDALILVKSMLAKNPEERISIEEMLSFPWVKNPPPSVSNLSDLYVVEEMG